MKVRLVYTGFQHDETKKSSIWIHSPTPNT